jgi:phage/plasmid-associated DNA primase
MSRALAGTRDKLSITISGKRNAGKSVLTKLLGSAAGGYHMTIGSGNLLHRPGSDDADKDNKVFIITEGARIVSTQEIEESSKLNGTTIKRFQTPDEMQSGRNLFQTTREVMVTGMLCMNGNDFPAVDPPDANEYILFRCGHLIPSWTLPPRTAMVRTIPACS